MNSEDLYKIERIVHEYISKTGDMEVNAYDLIEYMRERLLQEEK